MTFWMDSFIPIISVRSVTYGKSCLYTSTLQVSAAAEAAAKAIVVARVQRRLEPEQESNAGGDKIVK
jgi:hypothetical protein